MPIPIRVVLAEDNPADAETIVRELRRADYEPSWVRVELKIIASSSMTDQANHDNLKAAGVDAIIDKPCAPQVVLKALRRLIGVALQFGLPSPEPGQIALWRGVRAS
jgi:hypothetical protein